jgi:hypothetical protein
MSLVSIGHSSSFHFECITSFAIAKPMYIITSITHEAIKNPSFSLDISYNKQAISYSLE